MTLNNNNSELFQRWMKLTKKKLSEQTKFWLSEIIGIENYFHQESNQRKLYGTKLSKYVNAFDCIDKALIVLSGTSSGVCIISSASIVAAPVGIASASFTLIFSLTIGIIKKSLIITRNKKKKHDEILMLAKSKLDSIETLVSQVLIDMGKKIMKNLMRLLGRNKNIRGWKKIWRMSVSAAPLKNKTIWDWIVLIQEK